MSQKLDGFKQRYLLIKQLLDELWTFATAIRAAGDAPVVKRKYRRRATPNGKQKD